MVTSLRPERASYLRGSIADYCKQTYPNRELVLVIDRSTAEIRARLASELSTLGRNDIRMVEAEGELSLGALRNVSVDAARGSILCQWDDDDFHHPARIERQLEALMKTGSHAVCLEEAMHFFVRERQLYCLNWRATEAKSLPGTLLCQRQALLRYPESGDFSQLGEDSAVVLRLQETGFHALAGEPHLYVYVNHGANSWGDAHHRMLAEKLSLSRALLQRREQALRNGLTPFDFGPGEIAVEGYNGMAFTFGAPS
jgi:glycosyltransferase involved in cell wall biosynthesis